MGQMASKRKLQAHDDQQVPGAASGKLKGVNYGNRFIPEDWMAKSPYDFFKGLSTQAKRKSLGDVVDIPGKTAKRRMLDWLDATIKKKDFQTMRELGVKVVRVPCGYWNWITYPGDSTPNGPTKDGDGFPVVKQFRNLQSIAKPEDYKPFFDRIFEYAASNGIQVLLDLHGLPGSQNGEIHSGVVTGAGKHPRYYFETDWNRDQASEAVEAMAAYGATKSNLYGLEVINEPQKKISHGFLQDYYKKAILKARKHLKKEVPIVVFAWAYDFHKWPNHAFDHKTYGRVLWDTHIYHFEGGDVKARKAAHEGDLEKMKKFQARGNSVFAGEWTVAGTEEAVQSSELHSFASWLASRFQSVGEGSMLWNFDGPGRWSFTGVAGKVDWAKILGG